MGSSLPDDGSPIALLSLLRRNGETLSSLRRTGRVGGGGYWLWPDTICMYFVETFLIGENLNQIAPGSKNGVMACTWSDVTLEDYPPLYPCTLVLPLPSLHPI